MGNNTTPTVPALESDAAQHILRSEGGHHALEKIMECSLRCIARGRTAMSGYDDHGQPCVIRSQEALPRDILQIGYNLGRLSELTGAGRAVWDATKQFVVDEDYQGLFHWAAALAGPVEGGAQ